MHRHSLPGKNVVMIRGLLDGVTDALEIADRHQCSFDDALEIQGWINEWRADAEQEAEKVIHVDFKTRTRA